jgi:hypothetical protein
MKKVLRFDYDAGSFFINANSRTQLKEMRHRHKKKVPFEKSNQTRLNFRFG